MSNLVTIKFNDKEILVVKHKDNQWVILKRVCENLSIDWESQRQRISRDYVLSSSTGMIPVETGAGIREFLCLPLEFLNGFLFGIDDSRIRDEVIKEAIRLYKRECYKVLYEHFHPKSNSTEISTQDAIFSKLTDIAKIHGDEITETKRDLIALERSTIALEKDVAMAFKMQQEQLHTQATEIAVLKTTVNIYNEQLRLGVYNQAVQLNQNASKLTTPVKYITIKDTRSDENLKPRVEAYSKVLGYYSLSNKLIKWAAARCSKIEKIGNLNAYPYQLVLDFFNPIHNHELAKIIDFSKFKEYKELY